MSEPTLLLISGYRYDECERCHKLKRGRWYVTGDDSGDWFCCDSCHDHYERVSSVIDQADD